MIVTIDSHEFIIPLITSDVEEKNSKSEGNSEVTPHIQHVLY